MSSQKKNSFYGGAAILAAGVAIVKIIGALYKIPLGNILSDAAFADFNTAYYIYSFLIVISTGGLPVALSKLVSEANSLGRYNQAKKTFRVAMVTFCALGLVSFAVMAFFPGPLADLMNNSRSYYSILALAPAIFFICPLSAFRGYFQGQNYMPPTAITQILEALCKLVVGLALAAYMVTRFDESVAAGGAIFGVSVGAVLAVVYMIICYLRRKRHEGKGQDVPAPSREILRSLVKLAVPITIGAAVVSIVSIIDTSLVFSRLQAGAGYTEDAARTLKGVYDKAMTLYNLPSAFMGAITISVIPTVSALRSKGDTLAAGRVSESALRTTALLAFPVGLGLTSMASPIMGLLYFDSDNALGGWMLAVLGVASIAVCVMLATNSVLQAYGYVNFPMVTTIVGSVVKIIVNYFLVGNPDINIKGAPIGTLACFGSIAILNLLVIRKVIPDAPNMGRVFLKPALASLLMGGAAWGVSGLLNRILLSSGSFAADGLLSRTGFAIVTVCGIGVGVAVYGILVLVLKIISKDDLALMPKGEKIAKILHLQ